ncbi:MAG: glycosyl transferase [Microbacteriaceae bacterium]|nr:glycosyl transferase [Microbacteriaceae bacterium]
MTVAVASSRRRSADWARAPFDSTEPVIDVLIPTAGRLTELAVTLAGLAAQDDPPFRVIISDQSDDGAAGDDVSVNALLRVLTVQGRNPMLVRHLPRRGLAEHRQFLLDCSTARYVLFLDDDVWLEPGSLERLHDAIERLGCGFVGSAVQGLSYLGDERPAEHVTFEPWNGEVRPERVRRGSPAFERWPLHNAANLTHIAAQLDLQPDEWVAYRVAWIGGCVLFDRQSLVECGGFDFWHGLPGRHSGEDVAAQWRVMDRFAGAGVLPSGAIHLEGPTTIPVREVDAFDVVFACESPPT